MMSDNQNQSAYEGLSVYEACVKAGVEIEHHYSDLYIPVNDVTRRIIGHFFSFAGSSNLVGTFTHQIKNALYYNIAFAYQPYWDAVSDKNKAVRAGS
jgi:hypothetical protein